MPRCRASSVQPYFAPAGMASPFSYAMPIRFRCPHCDQLMGIARRKTGLTVRCPRCSEAVVVPAPDLRQASHVRRTVEVNQPRFERKDFDEIFAAALAVCPGEPDAAQPLSSDGSDRPLPLSSMIETTVDV